jgi:predicted RNA-binding Zn-ribbon protein involved in translation (DUF1610 family)
VSDRKYRQHGYMDRGEDKGGKREEPRPARENLGGPRPLQMPGKRTVSRCAQCGTVIPTLADPPAQCPKCGFELHACKQCTYFDPSARFECRQPIPERIARKDVLNQCTFYSLRTTVERETSSAAARVDDARKAFENLFKK